MLCDKVLEMMADPRLVRVVAEQGGSASAKLADVARRIRAAQRFVLSPHTLATINDLCDPGAVERTRDHLFFPAHMTWLEWTGDVPWHPAGAQCGCLFVSHHEDVGEVPRLGTLVLYVAAARPDDLVRYVPMPGVIDLAGSGPIFRPTTDTGTPTWASIKVRLVGAWIGAALALINTPRIAHQIPHEHSTLNASRLKRGKPPVLSWHKVEIAIDRGELAEAEHITPTGERALHHVRAHLRLRRGRVETVRPHWRGTARVGMVRHRYVVTRAEDEAGPWQGGPLPLPEFLP